MNKDQVLEALRQVTDPQTGQDIVKAGLVQDVECLENGGKSAINFTIAVPSLNMPGKAELNFACIGAVQQYFPNAMINVHFMARTAESQANISPLPHVRNIIAVASGKGGVGKSTVAVNLALGLKALGARVGLMDADVYGPSMPTMLGLVGERPRVQEIYGKVKMVPLDAYGIYVISIGNIIEPEQAVVLRGPRLAAVIKQFVAEVVWPELDYLIIDLPPGTGDVQLSLVQTVPVTGVILVTTPQEVALADAIKAMNMFLLPQINVPILGVVENMSWFTPAELPQNKYYIFGSGGGKRLAQMANTVLLGQIPLVQGIREGGDGGRPAMVGADSVVREAFLEMSKNAARQIAVRNEILDSTRIVQML
jgi:ATP-binding protein involved in chromosome partitioning